MVGEMPACISLRWSINYEVEQSVRKGSVTVVQGCIRVVEWFRMKCLQPLKDCMIVLKANHALAPFTEKIPCLRAAFQCKQVLGWFQIMLFKLLCDKSKAYF